MLLGSSFIKISRGFRKLNFCLKKNKILKKMEEMLLICAHLSSLGRLWLLVGEHSTKMREMLLSKSFKRTYLIL